MPHAFLQFAAGVLLGFVLGGSPVRAQITVEPQSLDVTVPQYGEATRAVTLRNTGSEAFSYCLSFARPLEEGPDGLHLAEGTLSSACGTYGEVLAQVSQQDYPIAWGPYGITMTPDGRIFTADYAGDRTHELTPELELVRSFEHPLVAGCYPFPATTGVTYNADTGTLWWLNIDSGGFEVCSALLLEGDLDGEPTGRQVELPVADTAPDPYTTGRPVGLSYDAATNRYYFVDFANDDIWAVDTLGNVIDGYPVVQGAWAGGQLGFGIDAHHGIEDSSEVNDAESLWLEVGVNRPGDSWITRVVAVGASGTWGGIETPTPVLDETGSDMGGAPLRSRTDPNGVMYYPYGSFDRWGVVAVRPHPLPPRWLSVGTAPPAWDGTLASGESREIILTFRAGARAVGDYTAALQVFDAATDAAVEVPLVLEVTEGTNTEDEAEGVEDPSLSIYPNPTRGPATVVLTLGVASEVQVAVYDVLGREVAVLHEGSLVADTYWFSLDGSGLPAGVYLVRLSAGEHVQTQRLTVLR